MNSSDIVDPALADHQVQRIEWAWHAMPVLHDLLTRVKERTDRVLKETVDTLIAHVEHLKERQSDKGPWWP